MGEMTVQEAETFDKRLGALVAVKTREEFRDQVIAYERMLQSLPSYEVKPEVFQIFLPGIYIRRIRIPEGTALTGAIHKEACYNMVLWGRMIVVTEEGSREVNGPAQFVSPAGSKRAGIALTDCDWINVHAYNGPELDPAGMAAVFTVPTFEAYDDYLRAESDIGENDKWV